jgi:hypothetical protein
MMPFKLMDDQLADRPTNRAEGRLCTLGEALAEALALYEFADRAEPCEAHYRTPTRACSATADIAEVEVELASIA